MKVVYCAIIIILSYSISVDAQHLENKLHYSVDLYEGLDTNFYTESNFGVKNPIYSAFPVNSMLRYNRVDGLFIGYQEDKMEWNNSSFLDIEDVDLHGLIGFSTGLGNIQYSLGAEKSIGDDRKWWLVGGEFYNSTSTEDYWRTGIFENSVSSLMSGFDYLDYQQNEGFGLYTLLKPVRNLELGLAYNDQIVNTVEQQTDFSIFNRFSNWRPNPAVDSQFDRIGQQYLTVGITLNPYGIRSNSTLQTTLSAKAELANLNGFDNDFRYNSYQAEAKSYLRLDKSTLLKWRLMAGSITGTAPDYKNFALGGIGSLRAFGYKMMKGNQMLLSNLELEFGNSRNNGNQWPDLSNTSISVFMDSGYSNFNPEHIAADNPLDHFDIVFSDLSHNIGMGLGLGFIKFEVAKPVTGAGGQSVFWIRLNPTF
ncbi:MAG: hypothetical protein U5K71_06835 [Gracilimonas sp.]|nr:hypothetical protein [Gracilimonas sp.]